MLLAYSIIIITVLLYYIYVLLYVINIIVLFYVALRVSKA